MSRQLPLLIFLLALALPVPAQAFAPKRSSERPCPHIEILDADDLDFTDAEKRLLCGDDDPGRTGVAWKDIPLAQAKGFFKTFLQDRGYFAPEFKVLADGAVEFDHGPRFRVRSVKGVGIPSSIRVEKYRTPIGEPLTPGRISDAKSWLKRRLQEEGYPCPEIDAYADAERGEITLDWINPSPAATIGQIQEDPRSGLGRGILRRYDAFEPGKTPYSLIITEVSARRSGEAKLTSSHDIYPVCPKSAETPSGPTIDLEESAPVGPPRLIAIGVSLNSEVGPQLDATWSHTRLGATGSLVEFSARASLKEQRGRAKAHWYYLSTPSRARISPQIEFAHQNERRYETVATRARGYWETGGEMRAGAWELRVAPGWQDIQQVDGVGPHHSQFTSLHFEADYISHLFHYHSPDPREGQRISISAMFVPTTLPGAGNPFSLSAQKTWLFAPGHSEPRLAIFGARARVFSSWVASGTRTQHLPIDFRQWLGGMRDLRGFGREELPDQGFGARQGLVLSSEVRFPGILPWRLDPLALLDATWFRTGAGVDHERLEAYWNLGAGLRWQSPVGTVRTTLARGFQVGMPDSRLSHLQVHLSLGEEF